MFGLPLLEVADCDKHIKMCDEIVVDWARPASVLLKEMDSSESGQSDDSDENDDGSDEGEIESSKQKVCSIALVEKYVNYLKEFALFHGGCNILSATMDIEEHVSSMRVECYGKQSKIGDFFKN